MLQKCDINYLNFMYDLNQFAKNAINLPNVIGRNFISGIKRARKMDI